MYKYLALAAAAAGSLLTTAPAPCQDIAAAYPSRPVRIVVNVAAGGGVDTATRIIAQKLHAQFGQPFVIENHPGAGGNIGAEAVFLAEPNGYTLLSSSPSPLAINGSLYRKLNFDPAGFEPIAVLSRIPNVLVVRKGFPTATVKEFIAHVKANPDKLNYGSQGIGTASHLTAELFMAVTGTKLVHVPYKGGTAGVLTDLVAGHLDLSFIQFSSVFGLHQRGDVKVLAVAADQRLDVLPDVPTMAQAGLPEVVSETWNAISAPPQTAPAIVLKLNEAINLALREPDVRARFRDLQAIVSGGSLAETRKFIEKERELWAKVIRTAGVPQL